MQQRHHVYVIAARRPEGLVAPVKVGVTRSLGARLSTLQTGCWERLEVAYSFALCSRELAYFIEGALHARLADYRLQGEWFSVSPLEALEELCDIVFLRMEETAPPHLKHEMLCDCGAVKNLKIVVEQGWGLRQ